MTETIPPKVGDTLCSPSGKLWKVAFTHGGYRETVYRLRTLDTGRTSDKYLREIAQWRNLGQGNAD